MTTFQRYFLLTLLTIVLLSIGFAAGLFFNLQLPVFNNSFPILAESYQILKENGLTPVSENSNLEYGMIRGMLQAYGDPYSILVEPAQHELESNTLQGRFGGIGVRFGRDSGGNVVLYPFPESPARKAGILDGDRLLKVDNLDIQMDMPVDTIQAAVRGPVGELVRITIGRTPDFKPVEYTVKRAEMALPSVTWHLDVSEPRLGVVEVNIISANTPTEIQNAVQDLRNQGATGYVLDLRDNTGGLLSAGIDSARLFLREGVVLQQQYRDKEVDTYRAEKPGELAEIPLVVLINENTASASEIIAGALQVNGRAKLIGSPSYGKDTIQLVFGLRDGSSLHVTAARWWIPDLEPPLDANGLQPDIHVNPANDPNNPDPAIQAAIQALFGSS